MCITIDDKAVSVIAFSKNQDIIAYDEYKIDAFEICESLICNPTLLQNFFNTFLQKYQLERVKAVVLLRGSILHETVCFASQPKRSGDGVFDWLQLDETYWYGFGLSYPSWLQVSLLLLGTDIIVKAMVPYFVVMHNVVRADTEKLLKEHDDLFFIQQKVQALFEQKYPGNLEKKFLLPGLDVLFDS